MYISNVDSDKLEITTNTYYPKETIILKNVDGIIAPDFVRVIESKPVPNRKLTVSVAENGYVVSCGNKVKIAEGYNLPDTIHSLLNKDVDSERELTEDELQDEDLLIELGKLTAQLAE